ncbi:MAG: hypothetical protein NC217_07460 [Muribaculaceae bacterium]|nr:hypothetical protein [Muribaculaceae bacterium]
MKAKRLLCVIIASCSLLGLSARQPSIGYRGFLDWNGEVEADVIGAIYGAGQGTFYTGFTTSHGYQFKPWLYAGVGTGLIFWPKYSQVYAMPVFADCRIDIGKRLFSPFLDVRLGANTLHRAGLYLSATVGMSVKVYKDMGINFGLGYTMTGLNEYYGYFAYDDYTLNHWGWRPHTIGHTFTNTLALRFGFEF